MNAAGAKPDPVTQAVIDGLLRRAAMHSGPAGRLLVARAEQLRAAGTMQAPCPAAVAAQPPSATALAALTALVERLGRAPHRPAAGAAFQDTLSRLRTQQRLRQALAQVPAQAGPLHSAHLVHRALQTLSALSPEYLDAMLAHVDTLLGLDPTGSLPPGIAPPPAVEKVNASRAGSDLRRRRPRTRA